MARKKIRQATPSDAPCRAMLARIEVSAFVGAFTYDLEIPEHAQHDGLAFLYGLNGSGKTTLLALIFHLLAPEPYGGHRTQVASIPFHRVVLTAFSGARVIAQRSPGSDVGPFRQTVQLPSGERKTVAMPGRKNPDGTAKKPDPDYDEFCSLLQRVQIDARLLSHRRVLRTGGGGADDELRHFGSGGSRVNHSVRAERERAWLDYDRMDDELLVHNVTLATTAIAREALRSRDIGTRQGDAIYADLVERLVAPKGRRRAGSASSLTMLLSELSELAERSKEFSVFDLSPQVSVDPTIARLASQNVNATREEMLVDVLAPYVDSVRARLDAIGALHKTLTMVVESLSEMFLNKDVTFSALTGFMIAQRNTGQRIPPTALSSGERQLLMLVCTMLASRARPNMLMIDEPEISLNVTWQRKIAELLLACVGNQRSSLFIATHSMEVLASCPKNIVPMTPRDKGRHEQVKSTTPGGSS